MKIFAIMNWAEGVPKITAINMMACVATERRIVEQLLPTVKLALYESMPDVHLEVVEFESVEGVMANDN